MKPKWQRFDVTAHKRGGVFVTLRQSLTRRQTEKYVNKIHANENLCAAGITIKLVPAAA